MIALTRAAILIIGRAETPAAWLLVIVPVVTLRALAEPSLVNAAGAAVYVALGLALAHLSRLAEPLCRHLRSTP